MSVIVPVFNEEKTVNSVIKILIDSFLFNEVIVINDGSTDNSLKILKKFGNKIKLISSKKNNGKGWAVAKGIELAKEKIIVLIDADLVNLNKVYLEKLIRPINNPKIQAVVGYRKKSKYLPTPFAKLEGSRVYYKKDLKPHL